MFINEIYTSIYKNTLHLNKEGDRIRNESEDVEKPLYDYICIYIVYICIFYDIVTSVPLKFIEVDETQSSEEASSITEKMTIDATFN